MQTTVHHFSTLPAGDAVPVWIHVCPAGTFRGADGRGPYTLPADVGAVIRASMHAGALKLPIDENHAIDLAGPKGLPSPAVGWIVELAGREDGLHARVEWNGEGRRLLEAKAYLGISPAIVTEEKTGRVVAIARASLTNTPNLPLAHLHHKDPLSMTLLEQLRKALGLAADAPEDAVVTAATTAASAQSLHAADLARIAAALGVSGGDARSGERLATVLQSRIQATGREGELAQTVVALQAQVDTLTAQNARRDAEQVVDAAITAGKPIRNMRDHYVARHMKDSAAVQKELDGMVSIHSASGQLRLMPPAGGGDALDEGERQVIALMGVDPKAFAETKKRIEGGAR
jgi:phage I-like protein